MKEWNEKCAVVGVYNVPDAALMCYYALFAMQHRGQEASGIATSNGNKIQLIKANGLVTEVFDREKLQKLEGRAAIGHNRYSTAGVDSLSESQPIFARYSLGEIALAHNGNLTNAKSLRQELIDAGAIFQSHLDTENLIHLIAKSTKPHLIERIQDALYAVDGAYCFTFLSRSKMFALRDRYGLRPLSLGRIDNKDGTIGYIVASETCAFDLIGAKFVRDIGAGEMLVFDNINKPLKCCEPTSIQVFSPRPSPCVFEYVYFARPDSRIFGKNVYEIRKNMGRELAREHKLKADMVIPVPDSGVAAALGYSRTSGIDFELGIIRNHYVGRTFIESNQQIREIKVRLKLNPIVELIHGKDIVVIDDSIVRGTTSLQIVQILRKAGANKIYMLISAPPTISSCYYGVDTPDEKQLICVQKNIEEVRKFIKADYLGFLSIQGMFNAIGAQGQFCTACFDGKYVDDFLIKGKPCA